jgi:hypothetical protein
MASKKINPVILTRIKSYSIPTKELPHDRAAHFLDWAAKSMPGIPISWPIIVKAITGQARMPHIDSDQVKLLRGKIGVIRNKLILKYKRSLNIAPDRQGVCATINADHHAAGNYTAVIKRSEGVKASALKELSILDASAISDPSLRAFVKTSASALKGMDTGLAKRLELLAGGDDK